MKGIAFSPSVVFFEVLHQRIKISNVKGIVFLKNKNKKKRPVYHSSLEHNEDIFKILRIFPYALNVCFKKYKKKC